MRSIIGPLLLLAALGRPARANAADFYASRPPYERPFPAQRVPRGLKTLSARECGTCHAAIYREWRQSVHSQAWSDPQFQAELYKQPGVSWMCVNCHTPLRNQLDSLVVGLAGDDVERPAKRPNAAFDAALQTEAITCAGCHVRDGAVEGPIRGALAPHATRYSPKFRSPELCLRCHQAVQAYPGKNFICTFTTGEEWRAGPFGKRGVPSLSSWPRVLIRTTGSPPVAGIEKTAVPIFFGRSVRSSGPFSRSIT